MEAIMSDETLVAEYVRQMREMRRVKQSALDAWEALGKGEGQIRGLEAERDDLIAEADRAAAAGDKWGPSYWNRHEADRIQKRIDEARAPKCPTCGSRCVQHPGTTGERP